MDVAKFWDAVLRQDAEELRRYFKPTASITWPCTNERFTVAEYIRANCEYPGRWTGAVERTEQMGDLIVTAARVISQTDGSSFHAVSFLRIEDDQIAALEEYWGDDGPPPQWRREMGIGRPIR